MYLIVVCNSYFFVYIVELNAFSFSYDGRLFGCTISSILLILIPPDGSTRRKGKFKRAPDCLLR